MFFIDDVTVFRKPAPYALAANAAKLSERAKPMFAEIKHGLKNRHIIIPNAQWCSTPFVQAQESLNKNIIRKKGRGPTLIHRQTTRLGCLSSAARTNDRTLCADPSMSRSYGVRPRIVYSDMMSDRISG